MNNNLNIERILERSRNLNMEYIDNLASNNHSEQDFKNLMKQKYKFLLENHEAIFNISLSQNYDLARLKFMLEMANKIRNNEITEHNASVQVGQVLVDQIVKPQLEKAGVKPDKK